MKSFWSKGLTALFIFFCSAAFPQSGIGKGVSRTLADYRHLAVSEVHYELSFGIPASRSETISAEEALSFDLKDTGHSLPLDFKEGVDHILKLSVNGKPSPALLRDEHLIIDRKLLVRGHNRISIHFIAGELSLNRNSDFLYTLLVPDRARTLFPCFDQPDLKARFKLQLTVPVDWQVVANAPLVERVDSGGSTRYLFRESDLFSTYLFSFVAGRFRVAEKQVDNRPMRFYFRETDTDKIRLSLDTIFGWHRSALHFLEDYTGIPFPFLKLDFTGIPDFQYGGMEHVGAIDYKASSLFLDSGATQDQRNARGNLIAHETSHMWFGDLVTMRWFNDVWMKEVFANFMADKITRGIQENNSYELKFLLTHYPRAYAVDRTEGANPIRQLLPNLQEAGSLYGAIIYDKAPVMMRQLERLMGAGAFRDGLREYLKKYSYSNATWPDLISILGKRTRTDLKAWNQAWVNTPGRPVFGYSLQQKNGMVTKLTISQQGERGATYVLPQFFEIAFIYPDHVEKMTVNMNARETAIREAEGKPVPSSILFNSSGEGYGLFPVDRNSTAVQKLTDPVMRASMDINLYENMLSGMGIRPEELLNLNLQQLGEEQDELIFNLLSGYVGDIYWRLLTPERRQEVSGGMEHRIWQLMEKDPAPGRKKILFRAYQGLSLTKASLDTLYEIWKEQRPPAGVKLSEDDYTSLALNLALKEYPDARIISTQLDRLTNTDRKGRLQFLMPAVSPDARVRDSFFASLKNLNVRKKEAWVADALGYLHHPLRAASSIRYLPESLSMLEDIQRTNDIFFPGAWLNASLGGYQSREAADIVRLFLRAHPGYNPQLRMKILQAADPLFRAERLLNSGKQSKSMNRSGF